MKQAPQNTSKNQISAKSVKGFRSYVSVNSNWVHGLLGNPRKKSFWASESWPPGHFLSNSPTLGQKMMVEFPGVGQNFPKLLAKNPLKITKVRKLRDGANFLLENLAKPLYFNRLKQNNSKVFKCSSLDIQLKQWICKYINIWYVLTAVVH